MLVTAYGGGQAMELKPGTADHTYMAFFPRTANPASRGAFVGFGSSGATQFTIQNEIVNGDVNVITSGTGQVRVNGNQVVSRGHFVDAITAVVDTAFTAPGTGWFVTNISLPGATIGDFVVVSASLGTGFIVLGRVISAGSVNVFFQSATGGNQTVVAGTTISVRTLRRPT
ncbi:MAG: hypothetical protein HC933_12435 [Pleurocapsa sp. SU_196_0]|nr:hypothetical protein [Pleurocapsa sp. SU_196_0]